MYSSTSTTSLVETQRKVAGANDPLGTQHVAPPAPASRTSLVIGFLFCIILYAFNGTESINIDYQTYYQYTSSFEMVPSFYKVDLSSLPSLSAAVKAIQDTYGYSAPTTTNTKTSSSSSAAGNHYSQNKNQDNIRYYNLALSTEENYKYSEMVFAGQYISIRSSLDYTYHQNYLPQRQLLQDTIISNILKKHNPSITDPDGNSCISPKNPWIVFTAGAMGSGKSYTIRHLAASDRFPLESFVTVDPDEIRRLLPEFELYLDHNPEEAGESTRKEAGFIAEMLTQIALKAGRNILVDGSLKDADWYQNHFNILRQDYNDVGLRIGILHITAPREAVFERSRMRSKITRRVVPRHCLEETLAKVPQSVKSLSPLVDFVAELHNAPHTDDIELVSNDLTWSSFRKVWSQSCKKDDEGEDVLEETDQHTGTEKELDYQFVQLLSKM